MWRKARTHWRRPHVSRQASRRGTPLDPSLHSLSTTPHQSNHIPSGHCGSRRRNLRSSTHTHGYRTQPPCKNHPTHWGTHAPKMFKQVTLEWDMASTIACMQRVPSSGLPAQEHLTGHRPSAPPSHTSNSSSHLLRHPSSPPTCDLHCLQQREARQHANQSVRICGRQIAICGHPPHPTTSKHAGASVVTTQACSTRRRVASDREGTSPATMLRERTV